MSHSFESCELWLKLCVVIYIVDLEFGFDLLSLNCGLQLFLIAANVSFFLGIIFKLVLELMGHHVMNIGKNLRTPSYTGSH